MNDDRNQVPNIQVNNTPTADHDLLIRLDTKFDILASKFDDLSENIVTRVDDLEKAGVNSKNETGEIQRQLKAHDSDISFLKKWFWIATGFLGAIEIITAIWFIRHYGATPF
jgi:hypothetical protein